MPLVLNGTTGVQDNSGAFVASTAVTASGTSIDFTSIPSWVKRVTVMFNGVSTNGSSIVQIQIGSGSVTTTGYQSTSSYSAANAANYAYATTGFILEASGVAASTASRSGIMTLALFNSNTWVANGTIGTGSTQLITNSCGGVSPTLGGTLDRVRITTVNGTDTFDAGSINVMWE
jgi:hypothetical protein